MSHELGPTARALVTAARDGLGEPDAATAARVRAKLAVAIGGATVATVAAERVAHAAATKATGSASALHGGATATAMPAAVSGTGSVGVFGALGGAGLLVKLAAILAVAGAVGGGTALVSHHRAAPPSGVPAIASPPALDDEPRAPVHVASPETPPRAPIHVASPEMPSRAATQPRTGHAEHALAARPAEPASPAPSLAREVELVDHAMAALRLADYTAALDVIAAFDRETAGQGQLAEDAAAIAIEAHCRLHDHVTDLLESFDRRWPSSAQRSRLTAACTR